VNVIDVVLTRTETGKTLGVECKFQGGGGSAEEKVPATIQDISAWPIPGVVVFGGDGFSANMLAYFHSTGKAVSLEDLEAWLRLFLACRQSDLPARAPSFPNSSQGNRRFVAPTQEWRAPFFARHDYGI
jgi:hypothetical protein